MTHIAPFVMVVFIVAIVSWTRLQRAKLGSGGASAAADTVEAERLRAEVRRLADRVQVLEQIVTDSDHRHAIALEREIEALRAPGPEGRP